MAGVMAPFLVSVYCTIFSLNGDGPYLLNFICTAPRDVRQEKYSLLFIVLYSCIVRSPRLRVA